MRNHWDVIETLTMRNYWDVTETTHEQNNEPLLASVSSCKHHRMVMKNKWYTGIICKHTLIAFMTVELNE